MSHGISSDYAAGSAQPENPAASNTTSSGIGGGAGIPSRAAPDSTGLTSSANPSLTSGTGTSHHAGASGISGGPASTTAGPHQSNVANKMDPRVDSDLDGRSGLTGSQHTAGSSLTGGLGSGTTGTHTSGLGNSRHATTAAGPHSSNIVNKADRVDSDRDGREIAQQAAGNVGNQHNSGLTGAHNTSGLNTGAGVGSTGLASTQTHGTTGLGGSHTAGPHSSNIANKADPRVDSDRDGRGIGHGAAGTSATHATSGTHASSGLTSSQGITSAYGSTTSGPHSSNIANKADPRDSDLDGRARHGGNPATGTGGALDTATAHTTATANRDSSITSSSGPSFTKSSSMNPPQLPPISGTGSSGFSELTAAKTQGLVGGRKSDHLASSNTGHFTGAANSSGIVAPSSRDDGLAGRHSSVPGLGAGVSQQEAAQEAKRHEQMDMAELNTQGGGAQGIHSQGVAAQGTGTQGIGSQGVATQGVGHQGTASQGVGAQGVGAQGVGAQGVGSQGVGSQGIGAQGVGHQGIGAQGVHSQGVGAQGGGAQGVGTQGVGSQGLGTQTAAQGTGTQGHAQGQRVRSMVDEAEAALSPSKTRSGTGYQTQPGTGAL